jgi:hypothetical protein
LGQKKPVKRPVSPGFPRGCPEEHATCSHKSVKSCGPAVCGNSFGNGFDQTTFGKAAQAFSALVVFPVASSYQSNDLHLGLRMAISKLSLGLILLSTLLVLAQEQSIQANERETARAALSDAKDDLKKNYRPGGQRRHSTCHVTIVQLTLRVSPR